MWLFVCGCSTACNGGVKSYRLLSLSLPSLSHTLLSIFQEAHVFIGAEKMEDVTEERIRAELSNAQAHAPTQWVRRSSRSANKEELVVSQMQYIM